MMIPSPTRSRPRAFTLIELLVVITIIAILSTIGLAVGFKVTQSGKANATRNVIRGLDQILDAYVAQKETAPPPYVNIRTSEFMQGGAEQVVTLPMFDGRFNMRPTANRFDRDRDPGQPSVGIFLLEAMQIAPNADALLKGIDPRFIERRNVSVWGWNSQGVHSQFGLNSAQTITMPTIIDAFGRPIRMGHPSFSGGAGAFFDGGASVTRDDLSLTPPPKTGITFANGNATRSCQPFSQTTGSTLSRVGDSDEGSGVGKRAYFYSPGVDGNPGSRADNIYGTQPTFPAETANIKN